MRQLACWIAFFLIFALPVQGADGIFTLSGSVHDGAHSPLPNATVLLVTPDSVQVAGGVSDAGTGAFRLRVPAGNYLLIVQYVGYDRYEVPLNVTADVKLLPIVLKASATELGKVVVSGQFITRSADRFVLNVEGSTQAIGRSADRLLALAPGVWITDEKLSVNGRTGTRVMVDGRMLHMNHDQLMRYLKNLRAEDIRSIEVIPLSGADYDADSQGGIIRINLRHRRIDGMEGSLSLSGDAGRNNSTYEPSATLNYHRGGLSLYTALSYGYYQTRRKTEQQILMDEGPTQIASQTTGDYAYRDPILKLGGVYALSEKHSVGAQINYTGGDYSIARSENTDITTPTGLRRTRSRYSDCGPNRDPSVTVNYIFNIDTLGSTFKLAGDWVRSFSNQHSNFRSEAMADGSFIPDSDHRNAVLTDFRIYSFTADYERFFAQGQRLKTGAKLTVNDMYDRMDYDVLEIATDRWVRQPLLSGPNKYTERIGAVYAIVDLKLPYKLSLTAGLRVEHTRMMPKEIRGQTDAATDEMELARQNYFSLFPSMNLSLPLNNEQSSQLILSYARTIERPPFWMLTPSMSPMAGGTTYRIGNPWLRPSFTNSLSLAAVVAHAYSISLTASLVHDAMEVVTFTPEQTPGVIYNQPQNIDQVTNYSVALTLPFTPFKWWEMSVNAVASNASNNYEDRTDRRTSVYVASQNTLMLPAGFSVEVEGQALFGKQLAGNMESGGVYNLTTGLKKRLLGDRMTAAFHAYGILSSNVYHVTFCGPGFVSNSRYFNTGRSFGISLRYNFKSGVSFKARTVESGSQQERSRMGKSSGQGQ